LNYYYALLLTLLLGLTNLKTLQAQSILDTKVSENFSGFPITDFFLIIEQENHIRFFYKDDWVRDIKIPKTTNNATIRSILEQTLKSHQLSHIDIQQNNIILVPDDYTYFLTDQKTDFYRMVGNPMEKGKYQVNRVEGMVFFGKTGEPLPGALVINKQYNKQTVTDHNGHYELNLPGGITSFQFSFIGLETNVVNAEIFSNGKLDVELMEAPIALDAVTVTADGGKNNVERTQMGMVHMDIRSINKLPVLMGEADIIKSMTLLPGVKSSGELSAGFNVRGGNIDQNLVLINDAPVYSTSHLFGMFSTLIPGSVSAVNLHKGTQPANFGSRASSVMEIKLKAADTTKIKGKAGIGILNSTLFIEGPVFNNRCSFLVGARTTYSNWMLKKIPDVDIRKSKASFYDLIGKADFKLNKKNNLSIFGYGSNDNFIYSNKNEYVYGSLIGGINYNYFINNVVTLHSSVSYSSYQSRVSSFEDVSKSYRVESGITEVNGRMELNVHLPENDIITGMEAIGYEILPGERTKYSDQSESIPLRLDSERAMEGAGFIQDNFKITDRVSLSTGMRYSWYSKLGAASEYEYQSGQPKNENTVIDTLVFSSGDRVKPYQGLEPRLGLRIGIDESSAVKLGYNVTRQYQHLISNTTSSTPADFWKSADLNIKPIINQQYSLGYFKNFLGDIIETSAELYYKTSDHVLEYKNGAILSMNQAIERDVISGFSKSYGLELMLRKNRGNFTGWVSYTLSKSLIQAKSNFAEETINNGKFYPTYNDRLHDLTVSMNYQITRRWTFGSNFIFSSGRPTTFPEKKYTVHQVEVVYYSDRNKYRLPPYHRFDVSITYEGFLNKTKKVHPSFTFSVYNVYGRKNIYSVYYKQDVPTANNNYQKYGLYKLSIIGVPIPSLTLNLSF